MMLQKKSVCAVLTLVFVLAVPAVLAQGQSIPGKHTIVRVTVLADRAEIVRRVEATAPKGDAIVVIEGLPPELDERTLRVEAPRGAQLQGISSDIVKRKIRPQTERLPILKSLRDKQMRINAIEASVLGLRRKVDLARSYRTRTLEAIGLQAMLPAKQLPKGKLDLESWGKALESLSEQELQALKKIRGLEIERFTLKQEVADLNRQMADHDSPKLEEVRRVHVGLSSPAGGAVVFELIYRVSGPTWRVRYDMRYDSVKKLLKIEGYGMVFQETGEHWEKVEMLLSNRMPVSGLRAPKIRPLVLEGRERDVVVNELATYSEEISAASLPASTAEQALAPDPEKQEPEKAVAGPRPLPLPKAPASGWKERPGLEDFIKLEGSLTGQEFKVLQKQSLNSGSEPRQVSIFKAEVPAEMVLESVPSISGAVYRRVSAVNSAQQSLLAGKASLHFDGNLIGVSNTTTIGPGGRLELSFGAVSGLNVVSEMVGEAESKDKLKTRVKESVQGKDGSRVYAFGRRLTLYNQSKKEVSVRILDTVPVSEVSSIKVSVDQKATSKHALVRPGILAFKVAAKPEKSHSAVLYYQIALPEELRF